MNYNMAMAVRNKERLRMQQFMLFFGNKKRKQRLMRLQRTIRSTCVANNLALPRKKHIKELKYGIVQRPFEHVYNCSLNRLQRILLMYYAGILKPTTKPQHRKRFCRSRFNNLIRNKHDIKLILLAYKKKLLRRKFQVSYISNPTARNSQLIPNTIKPIPGMKRKHLTQPFETLAKRYKRDCENDGNRRPTQILVTQESALIHDDRQGVGPMDVDVSATFMPTYYYI